MEVTRINLDKICAEYGMDLLKLPKNLYATANKLINSISSFQELQGKEYNKSKWDSELKEFFDYKLVNPLLSAKKWGEREFNNKKDLDEPLKFDPKNYETEITKALGILVEDGPFAYMIWLKSQDKEPHRAMLIQTARILGELKVIGKIDTNKNLRAEIESKFLDASSDLTKTLFIKTVLEKMLVYARYKAKAMQNE